MQRLSNLFKFSTRVSAPSLKMFLDCGPCQMNAFPTAGTWNT